MRLKDPRNITVPRVDGVDHDRRLVMTGLAALCAGGPLISLNSPAFAQSQDSAVIGWPSDVPSWDPNQRFSPDSQPLFKLVFDQPLDQDPALHLIPKLITKWDMAPDGLSLSVELRDDVSFHNGDRMTADDFRYTFFERIKAGHAVDTKSSFGKVSDIEVQSPTKAVMKFSSPRADGADVARLPRQLHRSEKYMESVGVEKFREKPVGTGPYQLVEYQLNSRIVLERNEKYWGPKPGIKRVIFEILKDPSARVAAIQSGQIDLTINVPVRDIPRLQREQSLAAEINPITRVVLLQVRNDEGFSDRNVRLAAHHAIDKAALSKAFYAGSAVPLSIPSALALPVISTATSSLTIRSCRNDCWPSPGSARQSLRGSSLPRPTGISRATTTWRARSSRCGRKSESKRNWKPSNTRNISSSIAPASFPRRRYIPGTTRRAIRKSIADTSSIRSCRCRRGKTRPSAARSRV